MLWCVRGALGGVLVWLSLAAATIAAVPAATAKSDADGRLTLQCPGTATVDGTATAGAQTYRVDTTRCAVAPWPAAQCRCIDETIACDNRDGTSPDRLIINRLTGKVVHARANWKFVGRCKRR